MNLFARAYLQKIGHISLFSRHFRRLVSLTARPTDLYQLQLTWNFMADNSLIQAMNNSTDFPKQSWPVVLHRSNEWYYEISYVSFLWVYVA
jgi:hypothetical protein